MVRTPALCRVDCEPSHIRNTPISVRKHFLCLFCLYGINNSHRGNFSLLTFEHRQQQNKDSKGDGKLYGLMDTAAPSSPARFRLLPFLKTDEEQTTSLSTSHTLSHTTVHSWFNASEYNVLINTVYINHAHTHTRAHTFSLSTLSRNLQKYLHQLIVTHVPSIVDNVLKCSKKRKKRK